jgi:ABC-2 type transport system ATP-binding protein
MLALRTKGISKSFREKGRVVQALRNVSLEVEDGAMFALLGPNGSGKTTLVRIVLTLLIPDRGEVRIFGRDPFKQRSVLGEVNFVPAEKPHPHLSVESFMLSYAKLYEVDESRARALIEEFKLEGLARKPCWTLSTGEASKLSLAKALLNHPRLLLLDEPMAGLDPKAREEIRKRLVGLNREGITIFFTTHDMLEVERLAGRIAFIKQGKVLDVREKQEIVRRFGSVESYWMRLAA